MRNFPFPADFPGALAEGGAGWVEVTAALFHTRGMKINCALRLLIPVMLLHGCADAPLPTQQQARIKAQTKAVRQPNTTPAPQPYYLPSQTAQAPAATYTASSQKPASTAWRDAPATRGVWTYAPGSSGSAARYGAAGAAALVVIRCDRTRPAVLIQRPGLGSGTIPATITTTSTVRRLSAVPAPGTPAAQNAALPFEIMLDVADPLLDSIAFSRGRFMLEMAGAATLTLPVWAEIGRVIEDCR